MGYTVDYVYKPPSEGRIQELLNQLDDDIYQLERIEASYYRVGLSADKDPEYQRIANQARDRFLLAEDLARQLGIDDLGDDDLEVKDFSSWADKQIKLSEGWSW